MSENLAPDASGVSIPKQDFSLSNTCPPPTLAVIGVGGCGINIGRRVLREVGELPNFANFIDTSRANIRDDINVSVIANSHGSGKIRTTNADDLIQTVSTLDSDVVGDTDIAIVIFGASGGTGSVAGPLLVKELRRRGKAVIAVVATDTTSGIDAKNTMGTLKSLATMSSASKKSEGFYLPTIIFETTTDRNAADRYLVSQTVNAIKLLKLPTYEIDRNDRLSFLDSQKTIGKAPGIHMLYVLEYEREGLLDVTDLSTAKVYADSALFIGNEDGDRRSYAENPVKHAEFRKDGIFADPDQVPLTGLTMSTSETLQSIIDNAAEKERIFANQRDKSHENVNKSLIDEDAEENGGLAL